ncbi:hypothetical protein QJR52_02460 [Clostridium baratii]|uniref:hypothetical protein n=1 Tax=Clostridium baratii TaxID=1561 RepID=UPI0005F2E58D|nr:hypothetical protein [Clostridium baratii]KJU71201.1 hypothetical protein UC77_11545 [Clostridium baratii]
MKFKNLIIVLLIVFVSSILGIYFFKDKFRNEDDLVKNVNPADITYLTPSEIEANLDSHDPDYYNNNIIQVIGEVKSISVDSNSAVLKSENNDIEVIFQKGEDLSKIKEGSFISVRGVAKPPLSKSFILRITSSIITVK